MWHEIESLSEVPSGRDLRLAVINDGDVHTLVFPCRRAGEMWVNARNGRIVEVYPTHWQDWSDEPDPSSVH